MKYINHSTVDTSELCLSVDTAKKIVSFIKDIRNRYNIPFKIKLDLFIDISSDYTIMLTEEIISKWNLGNLNKVECNLFDLFDSGLFFEYKFIDGYNCYIALPIDSKSKIDEINKEIIRLEGIVKNCSFKLSNRDFYKTAPKDIVESEIKKQTDSLNKIKELKSSLLLLQCGKKYYYLLNRFGDMEHLLYQIQEIRVTDIEQYSLEWFAYVYNVDITADEIKLLYDKLEVESSR